MRHLHEKVKVLSERTAPEKASNPDSAAAASMMMGGMMMNDTLMIGYGGPSYGAPQQGYGMGGDIPDPYQQQGYGAGYGGSYGMQPQGGMGGGYY